MLEPGTAPPLQRLRAVRELVDAGMRAGVLMNPIVPGITSKPALLERTMKAIADHGARFVGCNVMFLDGGTRDHFMRWLEQEFPELVDGYRSLYTGKYASSPYRKEVAHVVGALRRKYGVNGRDETRTASRGRIRPLTFDRRPLTFDLFSHTAIASGSTDAIRRGPTASMHDLMHHAPSRGSCSLPSTGD